MIDALPAPATIGGALIALVLLRLWIGLLQTEVGGRNIATWILFAFLALVALATTGVL